MREIIARSAAEALSVIEFLGSPEAVAFIEDAAHCLADVVAHGGKALIAGNGGSLCDAAHFAEELTGFFRKKRVALPAIALSDPGHITCVANDLGFDYVFSRAIEAYGKPGDLFIGLTTSGNSPNIVNAFHTAKSQGLRTIAFLGKEGGLLKDVADIEIIIKGFEYSDRIQEAHMTTIHIIIECFEYLLENTQFKEMVQCSKNGNALISS